MQLTNLEHKSEKSFSFHLSRSNEGNERTRRPVAALLPDIDTILRSLVTHSYGECAWVSLIASQLIIEPRNFHNFF